jgi:hypothetical protein
MASFNGDEMIRVTFLVVAFMAFLAGLSGEQAHAFGGGDSEAKSQATGVGVGVGIAGAAAGAESNAAAVGVNANKNRNVVRSDVDNTNVNLNGNRNTNRNVAKGGTALSGSVSEGGDATQGQLQGQGQRQGQATTVNTGDTTANGGQAAAGDSAASTSTDVSISTTSVSNVDNDFPVAQAAAVFGTVCNSGGSVQTGKVGISSTSVSTFCRKMTLFSTYWAIGDYESARTMLREARNDTDFNEVFNNLKRFLTLGVL